MRSLGLKHIGKTIKITKLSDDDAFAICMLHNRRYICPVLNVPVVVKSLVAGTGRNGGVLVYDPSVAEDLRKPYCILNYLEFEIVK